ncbi:MAG: hypothetical protein H7Z12_14375 [Rhodospirillaceae bacterium]|nr:hypothetical protein [Rhodospirillales bacterium]
MIRRVLALVLVVALGGCVRTRTVEFQVAAPEVQSNASWTQSVDVSVVVADLRSDQLKLGKSYVRGVGGGTGEYSVQTSKNMDAAIKQGIEAEFRSRGVSRFEGPAKLLVNVSKAEGTTWVAPWNVDVDADANLAAKVIGADGAVLYERTFRRREPGKGEVWTMDTVEQGAYHLQRVMASVIRDMVDDERLVLALVKASRR